MPRMSYNDVYEVIAMYANEMLPLFADGWERFPQGGIAATIVDYLNDQGQWWYGRNDDVAKQLIDAATEIITREKS